MPEKPQDWMTDGHTIEENVHPPSTIPAPNLDPYIIAIRDAYKIRFEKMSAGMIILEVYAKLVRKDDRWEFDLAREKMTHPQLVILASKVMAAKTERPKTAPKIEMKRESIPIAMPEILESDKRKDVASHRELNIEIRKGEPIVEKAARSLVSIFDLDDDEKPTRNEIILAPIPLAVMKDPKVPESERASKVLTTILPSPAPNMSKVSSLPYSEIPHEERAFRVLTKRESGKRKITEPKMNPPVKGSMHSAIVEFPDAEPDSGRYEAIREEIVQDETVALRNFLKPSGKKRGK